MDQQVVGFLLQERTALAIAGDIANNQLGIDGFQRFVAQTQPSGGARREVLQQHVGTADQPIQHRSGGRLLHIEGDAALAAIEPHEMAALAMDETIVVAGEIADARPFDLDDIAAHVREVPAAQRRGDSVFQRDGAHALQGATMGLHFDISSWHRRQESARRAGCQKSLCMAGAMPGAQARIGLPATGPSPAMKSPTSAPASAKIAKAPATSQRLMCISA